MHIRKEAELNAAILHFIAKCLADGDEQTLSDLGLDRKDAEAIESLYLTDIDQLSSVHFALLRKASIDRDLFHRLIEHVRDLRECKSVRDELLALDAPFPMMQEFFGMDASEYAERGWRLQIQRHGGRPAEPSENEETAVWRAYEALHKPEDELPGRKEYLALCKATRLSARTVWTVMHRLLAAQTPVTPSPHKLGARHIGLMDRREAERCLVLGTRALRRAMGTAPGYKYEGVKREDIRQGNAKAQKARERMGEVPPEILEAADGRGMRQRSAPSNN